LHKLQWTGTELILIDTVTGPTYANGIFVDLYGNLVIVNVDADTSTSDRFYFYDTDLNEITYAGPFQMLQTWDAAVGGTWIQGDAVAFPAVTVTEDAGDNNTAAGSQALRGADAGAEPNEATVGGYKAAYPVETSNRITSWGAYSLGQITTGDDDIALGPYAGWPITAESDYLVFDSRKQDSINEMETHSIIVGQMADDPNDQWLNFNVGELNLDFGRFDVNDVNVAGDLTVAGTSDLNDVDIAGDITTTITDTQVIFSDGGILSGDSDFVFDNDANQTTLTNSTLLIDQGLDAIGLNIDSEATTTTKFGLQVVTGQGAIGAYFAYGDGNNGCAYLGCPNNESNAGNFVFIRNLTATSTDSAVV
jgi:hypothetical protein